jgi:hypothetical protein
MKIIITDVCIELQRAGVKIGDEYKCAKIGNSYFFTSPDYTECVAYDSNCKVIESESGEVAA